MALISRNILDFGAGLLAARARIRSWRHRKSGEVQHSVFNGLIPKLARASAWKEAGVEKGMDYGTFRERVPLQTYETLAPHIESMKRGAADVLWPGSCQIYAASSGTTEGRARHIPVTEAMMGHFREAGMESMLWYSERVGNTGLFHGRHLLMGGSTALSPIPESGDFEAYSGDMNGIMSLNRPDWMEKHLYEPGAEISQIADWSERLAAITERTVHANISLLAGIPAWILLLAEALRTKASGAAPRVPHLQAIWPNFGCYVHGGLPIAPFQDELRSVLGPTVHFHEVYAAAEGFVAAQDAESPAGLRLMADAGIFYEFLPASELDGAGAGTPGGGAVPLAGVATGVDYALVVTTPAGLARYLIGDVVRFVSTEPPRLHYVGRTTLRLNAFGERVIEKEITDALVAVCRRHGWTIANFHVAPIFPDPPAGTAQGRHEWWVELKAGTTMTPTGPIMAPDLDTELKRLNRGYEAKRGSGVLEAPVVRLVMPGTFEHWMRYHGKWDGRYKTPHCRSDRLIADELGSALQFAKD